MVEALKHLLDLTILAGNSAGSGDFQEAERFISRRGEVLGEIDLKQGRLLTPAQKALARETYSRIAQMDEEIAKLIKEEMKSECQDMAEITGKLRVLAAYLRNLPRDRQFDRIL